MASKKTAAAATACECSLFDAVPSNLTEKDLADGSYPFEEIGCTATTKNTFAPGHDAKLKSFLIKQGFAGWDVRRGIVHGNALGWADTYGFGSQVRAGIAKLQAKADAKAKRPGNIAKAERKLAESAKVVAGSEAGGTTHRSYQPTPEAVATNLAETAKAAQAEALRTAASMAEIVAAEEAKHAAEVVASRPAPEWDDAPILEDEAAMNTHAREEREAGLVVCKVGRWEYQGVISDDEKTFTYVAKDGSRKDTVKFMLMRTV